jgi:hypothetical protein
MEVQERSVFAGIKTIQIISSTVHTTNSMTPNKVAFLVGVSDYGSTAKSLEFCEKDVDRLAEVLERKGFTCEKWINKKLNDIIDTKALINHFKNACQVTDTVLFYFSGHGMDLGGEQLLLGKGVRATNMNQALYNDDVVPLSRILELLAGSIAQKIVIIDACRVPSKDQSPAPDLYKERGQVMRSLTNCAVVFSSADSTESFGTPSNEHSRFTFSLTEELRFYGRGLLSILEATTRRLNQQFNDGKSQTPWIYASLQDRALDGYAVLTTKTGSDRWPDDLCGGAPHGIWAVITGSNALALYSGGTWVPKARLPEHVRDRLYSFDCNSSGTACVFLRSGRKSLAIANVTFAPDWQRSVVHTYSLGAKGFNRYFGACWSPAGTRLLAFGAPAEGNAGLRIWNLSTPHQRQLEPVDGVPLDVECNVGSWIDDDTAIVSFCKNESGSSHIYFLEKTVLGKWTGSCLGITPQRVRVTALTISNQKSRVYLGCDDGSTAFFDLNSPVMPICIPRQHDFHGRRHYGKLPWSGESRTTDDLAEPGVVRMVYDDQTGLLGITYFDSTVALFDPLLGTYVKTVALPGLPLRPRIALVGPSIFLVNGGAGHQLHIQAS